MMKSGNGKQYTDEQLEYDITESSWSCEETFQFIKKYKYDTKHMSHGKYKLFMVRIFNMFNWDWLVKKKKNI